MVWRFALILAVLVVSAIGVGSAVSAQDKDARLITVFDRGTKTVFLSKAATIGDALKEHGIQLDARDTVEPSVKEELIAPDYQVNIYRARPVIVVDGATRLKIVSPYQTAQRIAQDVGIAVYDEDVATLRPSTDFVGDGAGLEMTIARATPVMFDLYGRKTEVRTQGKTVGEMLEEKKITLEVNDRVSLPLATPITAGMDIRVWREGKQTVTLDEPIPFESQRIFDADREVGYKLVKTPGRAGSKAVTYQIEVKDGVELSRIIIASIDTRAPQKEIVVVGIKPNAQTLTKSMGAHHWTDSRGITHRETYYDLDMGVVMQACGQGGYYTIRPDGAKIDREGYVIIAANYARYPRCTVVETSMGPGKVYDTGGFARVHPEGFDLATDWTNYNGR